MGVNPMLSGNHPDRPVRLEVRDGREVVVKTYRRGGSHHVYGDMLALWMSPFGRDRRPPGMPQPLSVGSGTGEIMMGRVPGLPLGGRGDLGDSLLRLPEVAALLADLHASGALIKRIRSADRVLASCRRKVADLSAGGVGPRGVLGAGPVPVAAQRVVDLLGASCPKVENLVSCHGDFSPRNVLGDADGVALIDMDRAQMTDPAHDLAYWSAWIWATDVLNDRVPSWESLGDLLSHYTGHLGDRSKLVTANLAFHQAAALVRIVHGWSALQDLPAVQCDLLGEAARLLGKPL